MPRYIVKHGERYLVWSTIVDAPITRGMSLGQLMAWWKHAYGQDALNRLERSFEDGGDHYQKVIPLAEVVPGNRAGVHESELTLEQIVEQYELAVEADEFARACMHCRQRVTLRFDARAGYFRGLCACGATCTSDRPPQPDSAAPAASPTSDSDAK